MTQYYKRRQFYIDKRFQTKFILKFLLVLICGGVISVVITMLTTQATLTSTFDGSKLVIEKTSIAILPSVILTTVITTGIVGIIAVIVTLLVSHKIAGPMYRFEKDLEEIAEGNLKKHVRLRDGDQFEKVASNLNTMVVNLNEKLVQVQRKLEGLEKAGKEQQVDEEFLEQVASCRKEIDTNFKL